MPKFKINKWSRIIEWLPLLLTLVYVVLISIRALNNGDLWFHLKAGEYILKNHTFPQVDMMSHTAQGREWIVHSWGYGALSYLIVSTWGLRAITLMRGLLALLTALVLFSSFDILGVVRRLSGVLIALAFYIISVSWIDRPHLLGNLFVCLLINILLAYRSNPNTKKIYFIPLITLLWANTHASLPIALVFMGCLLGGEFLGRVLRRGDSGGFRFRPLMIVGGISLLTSLVSPYHFKLYRYFFKIAPLAKENIFEWLPLSNFFGDYLIQLFVIFMAIYWAVFLLSVAFKNRHVVHFEVLVSLLLTYLSFTALRHLYLFVLVLVPFFGKYLQVVGEKLGALRSSGRREHLGRLGILGVLAALNFGLARSFVRGDWGLSRALLPVEAVDFVEREAPEGKMFNHFNLGGYLLWRLYPRYQTFIDGRLDMFVPDIYQEWLAVVIGGEDWERVLEKYDVTWIIIPTETVWEGLREASEAGEGWILIYWDDMTAIFTRDDSRNQELADRFGYFCITPFGDMPAKPDCSDEAVGEYQRAINASPLSAQAHNRLGVLYFQNGQNEAAGQEFRASIDISPNFASPYFNLGLLDEAGGNYESALEYFHRAVSVEKSFAPAYKYLGLTYGFQRNEVSLGIEYLERYLKMVEDPEERYSVVKQIYNLKHNIRSLE